ncbi:MAG: hypothetical protein AAGI53_03420 [Planctomycetota bacterium]
MTRVVLAILATMITSASAQTSQALLDITESPEFREPGPTGCWPFQWYTVEGRSIAEPNPGDDPCGPPRYTRADAIADTIQARPLVDAMVDAFAADDAVIDWADGIEDGPLDSSWNAPSLDGQFSASYARRAARFLRFDAALAAEEHDWERFTDSTVGLLGLMNLMTRSESTIGPLSAHGIAHFVYGSGALRPVDGAFEPALFNDADPIPTRVVRRVLDALAAFDEEDPFGYRAGHMQWTRTLHAWFHLRYVQGDAGAESLAIEISNSGLPLDREWPLQDLRIGRYLNDMTIYVEVGSPLISYPAARLTEAEIETLHRRAVSLANKAIDGWHAEDAAERIEAVHESIRSDRTQVLKLLGTPVGSYWIHSQAGRDWLADLKAELEAALERRDHP